MKSKEFLRRGAFSLLAVTQFLFFPVYSSNVALAEDVTPTPSTTTTTDPAPTPEPSPTPAPTPSPTPPPEPTVPPEPPKAGPPPPGADSKVFTYDYGTDTWESFLYTYNPVTRVRTMKNVPTVRYNFGTGMWEKIAWSFSAPTQAYYWYVVSTQTTQPAGIVMGPTPQSVAAQKAAGGSGGGTSVSNTGPNSNVGVQNSTNNNTGLEINNNSDFNIMLDLLSRSGNASVLGNTTGGSATTGNASSTANILNQIQSKWDINDILTFSSDIYGNVFGDLLVNTQNIGPNANVAVDNTKNNNLDIDVNNDTTINNDINVVAQTGDANVSRNTTGGDAVSGDASAFVNIINMINSSINSGAAFMGTLNIYGEFDGDILFPQGALDTLIASTGPDSSVDVNNQQNNTLDAEINNNTVIDNNIRANAASGSATVSGNTTGGDAISGNATSSVTMLNLTGKDVVSENTLLVFINVLGKWVGVLMDAPTGATAAAIGSGAKVSSNNALNNNLSYTENNNAAITNNVNVEAQSGDATVSGNTTGGDAISGDANANVNVANLVGSNIASNSWFGVLFINVFGTWNGSFGVDTEAGDSPASPTTASAQQPNVRGGQGGEGPVAAPTQSQSTSAPSSAMKVYSLATTSDGGYRAVPIVTSDSDDGSGSGVAGATDSQDGSGGSGSVAKTSKSSNAIKNDGQPKILGVPTGIVIVSALSLLIMFGNKILMLLGMRKSAARSPGIASF